MHTFFFPVQVARWMGGCLLTMMAMMIVSPVSSKTLSFDPAYTSAQFPPTDRYHLGCDNVVDITFPGTVSPIESVDFGIRYDAGLIEIEDVIVRGISSDWQSSVSHLNDTMNVSVRHTEQGAILSGFTVMVRFRAVFDDDSLVASLTVVDGVIMTASGDEYPVDGSFDATFAAVASCDRDFSPPTIDVAIPALMTPDDSIQLSLSDMGGIDWSTLRIAIGDTEIASRDYVVDEFASIVRLPFDVFGYNRRDILTVIVADKPVVGDPNIALRQEPVRTVYAPEVCEAAGCVSSLAHCPTLDQTVIEHGVAAVVTDRVQSYKLLAMIGWILFVLSLLLKISYMRQVKTLKKHVKMKSF